MNIQNLLWVLWKNKKENKQYVIAKLYKDEKYYFEYCSDYKKAKEKGCLGFFCFPDDDKIYKCDTLFSVFSTRLPSRNREDIREILSEYGLNEYDAFELLKKTRGRVMTDNFEFVKTDVKDRILKEQRINETRNNFRR